MKNKEARSIFSSLENFSSPPPPELWDKIEAELEKPKKKRRPVIWWWVAAGLVAGLSLPTVWYVNNNQGNIHELKIENANGVVLQNDEKGNANDEGRSGIATGKSTFEQKNNSENDIANENLNASENRSSVANANSANAKNVPEVVVLKSKNYGKHKRSRQENQGQFIAESNDNSSSNVVAANKNANTNNYNSALVIAKNNSSQISNSNENKRIANTQKNTVSESLQPNKNSEIINQNAESSVDNDRAIAQSASSKDSLINIKKEVAQLENALVELDKDKRKKDNNSEVIDKWSLQVFAGVMSSENYNNEKVLGNTVASKQSNGYGIKTNYKLNKKWAVSSGFKINELGQTIEGVSYYERQSSAISKTGLLPIAIASNDSQLISPKNNNIVLVANNENYLFATNTANTSGYETGNVTQNLKYFEMPLEISYSLLSKKKTSISMNTGGFVGKLISNEVLLNGSSIGENNNVNEFIYGTLLSSTLQYEFLKKTKFFIEPGMNYYINPLENQSFNQFQWMFNVGINVSF
ncbi:hypothetical protein [Flavobacterium sp.]|uniref:hypothetical protein n=1 Tax=Flavobacterium sp. TaxID=239 RepID=UPI002BE030C4|nr:hypothetical protein [Flavobacterium sp.]HSD07379.1 hypothetical protein [Flavobacterium sp.]